MDREGGGRPHSDDQGEHHARRAEAHMDGTSGRELHVHLGEGEAEHRRVPRDDIPQGARAARAEVSVQRLPVYGCGININTYKNNVRYIFRYKEIPRKDHST